MSEGIERLRALGPRVERELEGALGKQWYYEVKGRREEAGQRFDRKAGHHDPAFLLGAIAHEPELESSWSSGDRQAAAELLALQAEGAGGERAEALVEQLLGGVDAPPATQPVPALAGGAGDEPTAPQEAEADSGKTAITTKPEPATPKPGPEANGDPLLQASNVSKIFGGLVAVNDIDFAVPRLGIVSLIGPNGAGKTTFFNCMTGLYKPTLGRVVFDGKDITGKRPDLVTQAGVARTFQNIKLFRTMTAIENVQVGMHARMKARITGMIIRTPFVRHEEQRTRERARELLEFVGLRRHEELAMNLPYGDQRRLEIARALGSDPKLLLLDEPTAGMNPQESEQLRSLMERLRSEQGLSVLLIEHDMKVVMGVSDHITVLDHGEVIAKGSPQEVRQDPKVIEAYLGSQG